MADDKTCSLKDFVYKQIIEMICSGTLTADTIITENQMIEHFKMSKSPVREALLQLCNENVVKNIPRRGYQVVRISSRDIQDLIELRLYLELSSLPKAASQMTSEQLLQLKDLNHRRLSEGSAKTIWTAWNNNMDFHLTLTSFAENELVASVLETALSTCTRAYAQLYNLRSSVIAHASVNYHDRIVEALEQHNVYEAYEYLKKDILFMEQELLNASII